MRPLHFTLLAILALLGAAKTGLFADEASLARSPALRHTSSLKFQNGSYASIFGIVPKEYKLESEETREVLQKFESPTVFSLEMVASETRRILSIQGEASTLERGPKPLTGKTLRVSKDGPGWKSEILGLENPTEEEIREAARMVARYALGTSPFQGLMWTSEGTAQVDLLKLLSFLGYTQISDAYGAANARHGAVLEGNGSGAPISIDVEANFGSGEGLSKIVVELKAKGELIILETPTESQSLNLTGRLAIHGRRKLEDGRVVPYNLITDFKSQGLTTPAGS